MSPDERARIDLGALVAEVRDDLVAVERLAERVRAARARACATLVPDPGDVMAVAGFLHHVYTAIESIHERIVATIDGSRCLECPPSISRRGYHGGAVALRS